jgi:nicotinamide mononucleotide adenylyltransferase
MVDDDIDDITFQPPIEQQPTVVTPTLKRDEAYSMLLELIFAHYDDFNSYCNVEGLVLSIQQYLENILDEIILQSDVCWGIRQNIELFCFENQKTKNLLKKIFVPDSVEEYEQFESLMEIQKQSNEINDLEEINKQIQFQKELEEQENLKRILAEEEQKRKQEEIEKRNTLISNLFSQMTRLGSYDKSVNELKIKITPSIEKYIALETDLICVTLESYEQVVKFIKQIRLDPTIKEELIRSFSAL